MSTIPDLTPPGWNSRQEHGSGVETMHYADGSVRARHVCDRGPRGVIIAAPALQLNNGHVITHTDPLTVTPSILCGDCGIHGFITNGVWRGDPTPTFTPDEAAS